MSSSLQSGVRFQALPVPEMQRVISQWIGCQRVVYNGKVSEEKVFASQRRLLLAAGEIDVKTPLDRCYSQFKDDEPKTMSSRLGCLRCRARSCAPARIDGWMQSSAS